MARNRPFMIDGVIIPTPDEYKFNIEDMSSEATGRTLDATMHKDVVAVKDYYDCTWHDLSWEDTAALLNAIDGKSQFRFTHVDPRIPDRWVTGTYYVGKRGGAALNLTDPSNTWSDISLTFTEV